MSYAQNEILLLTQDVKHGDRVIKKDTEVQFVKLVEMDITKTFVHVKFEEDILTLPELLVKPKLDKYKDQMMSISKVIMRDRPDLVVYHPNPVIRFWHKLRLKIIGLFKKEKKKQVDLSTIKQIVNETE